jgi:hypothetical protein
LPFSAKDKFNWTINTLKLKFKFKTMTRNLRTVALIFSVAFFASCSPYGKKVEINSKSEVYVEDGATEEEARRLGDFLLRNEYFDNTTEKRVQILKDKETHIVKFVVNEDKLKNNPEAEAGFQFMQMLLKDSIFNGKPTRIILADDKFKEIRTVKEPGTEPTPGAGNTEINSDVQPDTTKQQ